MNTSLTAQAILTGLLAIVTLLAFWLRHTIPFLHRLATKTASKARPDTVYRLRGVPGNWDEHDLQTSLNDQFEGSNFTVGSLSIEHHERSKTATVNCPKGTALPQSLSLRNKASEDMAVIVKADTNFHGITTLYAPPPEEHMIE